MSVWRIRDVNVNGAVVDVLGTHVLTHVPVGMGAPLCVDTDTGRRVVRAWAWWHGDTKELVRL